MAKKNSLSKVTQKPVPVKIVSDCVDASPKKGEYDKWRAEDDLRALQRAAEIKADKTRMSQVKKCADEQLKVIKSIK
jgi:hypothetical protein